MLKFKQALKTYWRWCIGPSAWWSKVLAWTGAAFVALIIFGIAAGGSDDKGASQTADKVATTAPTIAAVATAPAATATTAPSATSVPATQVPPTQPPLPPAIPTVAPTIGDRTGAVCRDGTTSTATGSGACSRHGGVDHWIIR